MLYPGVSRRQLLLAVASLPLALAVRPAWALDPVFSSRGKAIRGYDPVAYFKAGEPVEGSDDFTFNWQGARWYFASAANRDAFAADPGSFAPRYGGYCAWAVSQGYTASTDPQAWHIVDGKLYLNYSRSVQSRWQKDVPGNIAKADQNWPGIRGDG